jgi:hypothetical protein
VLSAASAALLVVGLRRPRCSCHDCRRCSRNGGCHCSLRLRPGAAASLRVAPAPYCRRRPPPPPPLSPLLLPPVVVVVVVVAAAVALAAPPHPGPDYEAESRIPAPLICCD